MLAILNVILPVFALLALGYGAVRLRLFPNEGVRGLIIFVNSFATPCLLFRAMLDADFSTTFNWGVIVPFYVGGVVVFIVGILLSSRVFGNKPGESVASGFSAMFTNTVLVGIPVVQRAYGPEALATAFSIIAFHAPVLITAGMLTMELLRRDGAPLLKTLGVALVRIVANPLLWGIALGAAANLMHIKLIEPAEAFVTIMAAAVTPAALFGLGGALNDYKLSESWGQSLTMSLLKLLVQPAIAWLIMVPILHIDRDLARYGVLLAAMPAGINVFVFATYYNRSVNVAANTILISTVLSVLTISGWLYVLGL
ncbi:MAG: malonate transporter [Devosia sp.]|uniref:AEC family transporter n=1 Tax=Devosia sp. TaxID=1871048 RepID=UPI00262E7553|nr:AEC family transporter [Devosia sp.]MDB5538463.1 malonate transporter [Devosia sp.]